MRLPQLSHSEFLEIQVLDCYCRVGHSRYLPWNEKKTELGLMFGKQISNKGLTGRSLAFDREENDV